jgi:hypothetical protein
MGPTAGFACRNPPIVGNRHPAMKGSPVNSAGQSWSHGLKSSLSSSSVGIAEQFVQRIGRLELANSGTIFLDSMGPRDSSRVGAQASARIAARVRSVKHGDINNCACTALSVSGHGFQPCHIDADDSAGLLAPEGVRFERIHTSISYA